MARKPATAASGGGGTTTATTTTVPVAKHVRDFAIECRACGVGQGGDRGGLVRAVVGEPFPCQSAGEHVGPCPYADLDTTK
jgi:hypothetical protein